MLGKRGGEAAVGRHHVGIFAECEGEIEAIVDGMAEFAGEACGGHDIRFERHGRDGRIEEFGQPLLRFLRREFAARRAAPQGIAGFHQPERRRHQLLVEESVGDLAPFLVQHPFEGDRGVDDDRHRRSLISCRDRRE